MSDTDLPTDVVSGKVVARLIKTIADSSDPDLLPDEVVIEGTLKFTPLVAVYTNHNPNLATVVPGFVICDIDSEGYVVSDGARGVWLPVGPYKVAYRLTNARIQTHRIDVLQTHTNENPLNLVGSVPPMGPILKPGEYATLAARIDALNSVTGDDPRLSDARPPTTHEHDSRYYTEVEIDAKFESVPTAQNLADETIQRVNADAALDTRVDALEAVPALDLSGYATDLELAAETVARTAGDTALDLRVDALELASGPDLSGYVTDAEFSAGLSGKAPASHTHAQADVAGLVVALAGKADDADVTAEAVARAAADDALADALADVEVAKAPVIHLHGKGDVTDFNEGVDDRVNALLVEGSNIDLAYDDIAGSLTVSAVGVATAGALSAEATARSDADTALDARVDVLEAAPPGYTDEQAVDAAAAAILAGTPGATYDDALGEITMPAGGDGLPTLTEGQLLAGGTSTVSVSATDETGNIIINTAPSTTERVVPGSSITLPLVGTSVSIAVAAHASISQSGVSKQITWRIRRDSISGAVVASVNRNATVDSVSGDDTGHRWTETVIDSTPTTGVYVLTAQTIGDMWGSATNDIWSDQRSFDASSVASGTGILATPSTDGRVLISDSAEGLGMRWTPLVEEVQDTVGAMIVGAGGTYNDGAGTITLPVGFNPVISDTAPIAPAIGDFWIDEGSIA